MKANSDKSKKSNKATRRVLAGVLCGASVLSLVLSLVMPPISQAIANDDQAGSTEETVTVDSSSESTDVGNTDNGDTENQNSDETEDGEADPSNGVEQGQPDGKLQTEDGELSDGNAVMLAAEGGQTEAASTEIRTADELINLANVSGAASFKLMNDIETSGTIQLNNSVSNITLDLNGCKIKHKSPNQPLFNITGGATLTVKDGQQAVATEISANQENKCGNLASMEYGDSNIPTKLIYYVTESVASGTVTNETLKAYEAGIKGAIVACSDTNATGLKLVNLFNGGHFNLESGVLTQKKDGQIGNLIYAEGGSTVNMSGGYVCGASMGRDGAGAGIHVNGSTLEISDGVIAGNYAPSGGGVYAMNSTVNMVGGIISGNGTNKDQRGYGAGICAENSSVTITNGYITNNKYQFYVNEESDWKHLGNGCHGGGGIAAFSQSEGQKIGSLVISGGYITGNYSAEAGGGVYAGAWNKPLSGFTFSGGTIASNVAQYSEGGGIRIAAPTVGDFNVSDKKAYITNNTTNTTNDWGGGGVFVQGSSDQGIKSASLNIYNALITNNHANGFGGGFAACPTGKTAITDTNGIAIFGNSDGIPDGSGYNRSGGTHEKTDDKDWRPNHEGGEITEDFKKAGHQDLFLIRDSANAESLPYIAAVTGQMLGGGAANWSGTIDNTPTSIGKYEGAQAKYMIGLKSEPIQEDMDAATAAASLFITGNRSNIHGGGIMTNGDVIAGSTTQASVYPKMKLKGSKVLEGGKLKGKDFDFQLLKQNKITNDNGETTDTVPSFDSEGNLHLNGCSVVDTVKNDINGIFTFDLGEVYADKDLVYYLVEVPDKNKAVDYDETIYKIEPEVVPDKSNEVLNITYTYYKVNKVTVTTVEKNDGTGARTPETESAAIAAAEGENTDIITLTNGATFTNTCFWIPKATKVVKGGEMKVFTLQLADNPTFKNAQDVKTQANGSKSQTLNFEKISYTLDDLTKGTDSTGRSAPKAFPYYYYVHEKGENSTYPHYKFDQSVYRFKVDQVEPTDEANGTIYLKVTYMKGSVGSDGEWKPDPDSEEQDLTETSTPTFTNTYSTSLPLSGMSGVTLTYLAGAAVLCAAAVWMHIRRKANAKGGERRE
jgi:hypothetical protein